MRRVCIVGGGVAGRSMSRRLMYDTDTTIISDSRYSIDHREQIDNIVGYKESYEESDDAYNDVCSMIYDRCTSVNRVDNKYEVHTDTHDAGVYDDVVICTGYRLADRFIQYRSIQSKRLYLLYDNTDCLRMRYNMDSMSKGRLGIVVGGVGCVDPYSYISIALRCIEYNKMHHKEGIHVDVYLEDSILIPSDIHTSIYLHKYLVEKGVTVHTSSKHHKIDTINNTVSLDSLTSPSFDNIIVIPTVTPNSPSNIDVSHVDIHTLVDDERVYYAGHILMRSIPYINHQIIDMQSYHIASSILSKSGKSPAPDSKISYRSTHRIYDTITSSMIIQHDSNDKVLYSTHVMYNPLFHNLKKAAKKTFNSMFC